jgi:preprotein translocase subunit YajC
MSTTAIVTLIAIVAMAVIFWLVIYSSRRGEQHRQKTSIKPPESHKEGTAS